VLDVPPETIAVRLVRITAAFADRLDPYGDESEADMVDAFYSEEPRFS
jgi:hypothetical protein